MLEERQLLELYLVVDAALGLEAAPVAEAVEKVRTAALRLGRDGVKAAAYAVIELLLPQRAYLRREAVKAPVDDVHSVTPLLIRILQKWCNILDHY